MAREYKPITREEWPDVWGVRFMCWECADDGADDWADQRATHDVWGDIPSDYAFLLECGHIHWGYVDDPA